MTIDELKAIPLYFVCSAAWEDEHTITYESEDGRLGFCEHTPKSKNGGFRKSYRHYHIDGKVYKSKEKFIKAIADFNPNVVPINRRPYQNTLARIQHEKDAKPKATIIDLSTKK